ncbi:MAG: hypothetical protein JNN24_10425 [Hyphomicrobium zavarzinii]|jgi:hypothetical protein|uniref:hypothetical protein n=1 Tax=Hyphomicrobium TaxID=81 RepID=UPI000366A4EE|nr:MULTISPECIES: hypothetical protein [Hyphomicrobium]MBL8846171.1 hypothetical protein [Hyphomicrobium zavarzinii]WBT38487.1 hypothetical protein PE058_01030 [Hyphomicrobium sp. DMF-1]HML44460.1 hypothetical protein [Hyphomicrobium zavarzinii]
MLTPRLSAAACLTALVGVAGLASGASAQANCDTYGKLAIQQQQENVALKCGFTGPEWSPDLKAHVAWCGGVGPDQWKVQLQKRKQQLDACKAKG